MTPREEVVGELGRRMLDEPHWVARAKAAERLSALFCAGALGTAEKAQAEEFFRLASLDGEVLVRRVLAESLKRSAQLSHETALLFAADRAEVAAPFIEHSPILGEEDLLRILRDHSHAHRLALARRFELDEPLSEPMLASGNLELITTVLSNPGAAVREKSLWKLTACAASLRPQIARALARRRARLPPRIAAVLFEMFADFAFPAAAPAASAFRGHSRREEAYFAESPRGSSAQDLPAGAPLWRAPGERAFGVLAQPSEPRRLSRGAAFLGGREARKGGRGLL